MSAGTAQLMGLQFGHGDEAVETKPADGVPGAEFYASIRPRR